VKPSRLALEEVEFYWKTKLLPLLSSSKHEPHNAPSLLLSDIELDELRDMVESPTTCPFLEGGHVLLHYEQVDTSAADALGCGRLNCQRLRMRTSTSYLFGNRELILRRQGRIKPTGKQEMMPCRLIGEVV
jgi:hypothetical protein